MKQQYHILNGDCLKEQFPKNIDGEIIVARECLVDGNVKGDNLDELFANRAKFLSDNYGNEIQDYFDKTVPEIQKILDIDPESEINLWFEDDLFCQVNFWFVMNLLTNKDTKQKIFLVRPKSNLQYGFGGMILGELVTAYENRYLLTRPEKIAGLWISYQRNDLAQLNMIAQELKMEYPFILQAVIAHLARTPSENKLGKPHRIILKIIEELNTKDFDHVFREFNRIETIYGFGDMQVKRILDEVLKNR